MTDKPIYLLAALSGDITLIDRVMADYVRTPGSANTSKGELFWYQTDVRFYEYMESILYRFARGSSEAFHNVGSKPKALLPAVVREIQWKLEAGAGA